MRDGNTFLVPFMPTPSVVAISPMRDGHHVRVTWRWPVPSRRHQPYEGWKRLAVPGAQGIRAVAISPMRDGNRILPMYCGVQPTGRHQPYEGWKHDGAGGGPFPDGSPSAL